MNDFLDPYDPASLRLDQSFTDGSAVKKLLITIPVRRPNRQDFTRVHPDEAYRLSPAGIIELKDDREVYLVTPAIAPYLVGEISACTLHLVARMWFTCGRSGCQVPMANITLGISRRKERRRLPCSVGCA